MGILKDKLKARANRIHRQKKKELREAAKRKYMEFLGTLPIREDLVVLEARNGKTLNGNIYYILRELLTAPEYASLSVYLVAEDEAAAARFRQMTAGFAGERLKIVLLQTEEYYRLMASAGFLVNDSAIRNFFIKKPGQTYLNVWHGTPLKTMGRRVADEPHATGSVQKNFIIADYLLYPSEYMMEHMIEDYMIADASRAQALLGGYPRNTAFYDEELRRSIREHEGLEGASVYAYMPTWRPAEDSETLQRILHEMEEALREHEVMYINIHPLAAESVDFSCYRRIRPFPDTREVYEFLNIADALVTDYSSVFYDFAVTRRPVVLFAYDAEEYFSTRGVYEPLESLPFPMTRTAAETIEALRAGRNYDDEPFLDRFCRYESADATKILCREVFAGEHVMPRRSIPSNGRENVLVYGGDFTPGARTDALVRFLEDPDKPEANYYLTFNRRDVNGTKDFLFRLPAGIRYIGRTGRVTFTDAQQQIADGYEKGSIDFQTYWEAVRPAFALEKQRYYGDMPIARVVQIPEGRRPGPGTSEEELEFSTY